MNHASIKLIPTEEERLAIFRSLCAWTGNPTVADDLVQQTLIEAWKSDHQPEPEEWRPWIFGVARNVLMRWRRDLAADLRRSIATPESEAVLAAASFDGDIDTELEQQEIVSLLHDMLDALPTNTRQVLLLKYIYELPQSEIASVLGLNEKALEGRLHRGKQKLRTHMLTHKPDTALSLGVVTEPNVWQLSDIWCTTCGTHKLSARWSDKGMVRFSCSNCSFGSQVGELVAGTFQTRESGRRPTFGRVMKFFNLATESAVRAGSDSERPCIVCGGTMVPIRELQSSHEPNLDGPEKQPVILHHCDSCNSQMNFDSLFDCGIQISEGIEFLRQYPQVRKGQTEHLDWHGRSATRIAWHALNSKAKFVVWHDTQSGKLLDYDSRQR